MTRRRIVEVKTYLNHYRPGVGYVRAEITLRRNRIIQQGEWQPYTPPELRVELRNKRHRCARCGIVTASRRIGLRQNPF